MSLFLFVYDGTVLIYCTLLIHSHISNQLWIRLYYAFTYLLSTNIIKLYVMCLIMLQLLVLSVRSHRYIRGEGQTNPWLLQLTMEWVSFDLGKSHLIMSFSSMWDVLCYVSNGTSDKSHWNTHMQLTTLCVKTNHITLDSLNAGRFPIPWMF